MARTSKVTRTASRNASTRRVASKASTQSQVLARLEALEANVANSAPSNVLCASSVVYGSKADASPNQSAPVTTADLLERLHVTIGHVDSSFDNVVARIHPILCPTSDGIALPEEAESLNLSPQNESLRSAILRLESMARYIDAIHNRVSC